MTDKFCSSSWVKNHGFIFSAYDQNVKWRDSAECKPVDLECNEWKRASQCPKKDEFHYLNIIDSFNKEVGALFWVVFYPWDSAINGFYETNCHEIEGSAFVHCQLQEIVIESDSIRWIKVKIENVIQMNQVTKSLPEIVEDNPLFDVLPKYEDMNLFKYRNWLFYDSSRHSNIGNWMYLIDEGERLRLVAIGEWDVVDDYSYLGNCKLSKETSDYIRSFFDN